MRFRLLVGAVASGTLIAASVAACGPEKGGSADATPSATASSTTSSDTSLDSMPLGSVGGGFDPLAGDQVASVPVGAGQTVTVPVAGQSGVPASGAGAVVLSVAVTGEAAGGSVTVYPADGTQPDVPSLSWAGQEAAPGLAVSSLSSGGAVAVHNSSARLVTVTLGADGYWLAGAPAAAGAFGPLAGGQVARVHVGPGRVVTVPVAGQAGVPASGAGAVALTVEAVGGRAPGSLTVYPAGEIGPNEPGLSWPGLVPASGVAVSALGRGGAVAVRNSSASAVTVTLAADGYWLSGIPAAAGTFGSLADGGVARAHLGPGQTLTVPVAGRAGVPASGTGAVALAVDTRPAQAAGSVTVYAAGAGSPALPGLSWTAHHGASGLVVSELSSSGTVAVHNSSADPVTVTLDAAGYWLSKGRVVSDITAKPTTVTLSGSDITSVSGDPASSQTVTLAAGAPARGVGRVVVAQPSATDPNGLLGIVTAVAGGTGGTSTVTLSPATLDQAYSTFDISSSQVLTDSDVAESSGTSAGQPLTVAATSMDATRTAAPAPAASVRTLADQTPSFGYDLNDAAFTCEGSGGGPTIGLTADLSKISVDLSLDANPSAPNMHFLVTADPVFNIDVGFTGKLDCTLSDDKLLTAKIPIPGTPGLFVDLGPVVELTADGQASIDFQWEPRAALGFDKGPGIDSETHGFGSSGGVGISATADADLFLGFSVDITLAGQIGVGGDFGPDLPASYDSSTGCVTVDGQLKADLTAEADIFVKDWSFTLATGTFDKSQLYQKCGSTSPPPPTAGGTAGSGTAGSGTAGSEGGSGTGGAPGDAIAVRGLAALNAGGDAQVNSISCASAGNCSAGGYYTDADGNTQAFVVSEVNGTWGTAIQVAGTGSLAAGAGAQARAEIYSVSCVSAGNCTAGGDSFANTNESQIAEAFLVSEVNGTWGTPISVPGLANLDNPGEYDEITSVSCVSAGNCSGGGDYHDAAGKSQVFVVSEVNGTWGTAIQVPGTGALNAGGGASIGSLSCASAGNCSAGGSYYGGSQEEQVFVVSEVKGTWGTAIEVPGTASADKSELASVSSVSCSSAGNCSAAGEATLDGSSSPFVVSEVNGTWGTAADLPVGTSLSCPSDGNCTAGGDGGYVVDEVNGSWGATAEVPGLETLTTSGTASVSSVSCWSAGDCAAYGSYGALGQRQVFVGSEVNGAWGTALTLPGLAALNAGGNGLVYSSSCAPDGGCGVGGSYQDGSGATQAFVASDT
jgi:hypothetical protein